MTDLNEQAAQAVDMASIEKAIGRLLEAWVPSIASKQAVDERIAAHAALLTEIRAIAAQPANVEGVSTWQERVMGMELNGMTTYNAMKAEIEELRAALSRRPAAAAEPGLLPLPEATYMAIGPDGSDITAHTDEAMHAYARAHLRAAGQEQGVGLTEAQCISAFDSWAVMHGLPTYSSLRDEQTRAGKDSERLDWLSENYFHTAMDEFDQKAAPSSDAWRFYLPKTASGPLRERLDAAMKAGAQGGGK